MQIARGRVDRELLGEIAPQHGGDRGCLGVPHAGVADQGDVASEFVAMGFDTLRHHGTADHLHVAMPAR